MKLALLTVILVALAPEISMAEAGEDKHQQTLEVSRGVLPGEKTKSSRDSWLGEDKIEHFLVSAMIAGFGFFAMREPFGRSENISLLVAASVATGAGIGKEYYDTRRQLGVASAKDLVADILGMGILIFLIKVK